MYGQNHYTFEYVSDECETPGFPTTKSVSYSVSFPDDCTWIDVVDEFFAFLGSVYGYPISAKKYAEAKGGK